MRKNKTSKKNKKRFEFNKRMIVGALVAVFATSVLTVSGVFPALYKSSVMSIPKHDPFDGTTYPIKKVPDWVNLSSSEWNQSYSEFKKNKLIDIPSYNSKQLKSGSDRNAQTTYSVVYMGNYEFDHEEGAGSHLAVNIKIPEGTPVYAIANGTVIKASTQNDGFGHHIVLQHNNFPTLDDKKAKETLYSSYSHLSELNVSDREVVEKGQLIGYSGSTGTATTPHLHFQIDNDNAPWHPFWPFTWQDCKDAGLDFLSAINEGLGKDKAEETTVNPMKYVQKYIGSDAMYTSDEEDDRSNEKEDDEEEEENEDSNDVKSYVDDSEDGNDEDVNEEEEEEEPQPKTITSHNLSFDLEVSQKYLLNREESLVISVRDQDGNELTDRFRGEVEIDSDNGLVDFSDSTISFDGSGYYFGKITGKDEGKDRIVLTYDGEKFYSSRFEVVASDPKLGFADVSSDSKYRKSIMYLASKGVVQGYSDGTFKPTKRVTRAEALKLILEGNDASLSSGKLKFSDTDKDSWYVKYVYTASKKNIVSGYPDKTFRPNNTVTKAEFLKILFNAMKVRVDDEVEESPYQDVGKNTWFAPYFAKAKELGVLDDATNINPSAEMTRQEIADAIYRVMQL